MEINFYPYYPSFCRNQKYSQVYFRLIFEIYMEAYIFCFLPILLKIRYLYILTTVEFLCMKLYFDHFFITLSIYTFIPSNIFFFSVSSSFVASYPKNRSLILIWADAMCLFWGCRESILQNSRWLGSLSGQGFVNFSSHLPGL